MLTSRREWLALGAAACWLGADRARAALSSGGAGRPYCAFIKRLQHLPPAELAERIAEAGFDGVEATIRPGGYIEPEAVPDELPKLAENLRHHGIDITIATTSILRIDQPHAESFLETAASVGVRRYRLGSAKYQREPGLIEQLDALRGPLRELAEANRQYGIQGLYENHAGSRYVGAPLWDLYLLLRDIRPADLGVAFDIRHATVEGGQAWPLHFRLLRDWIGAVYVKDFSYSGRRIVDTPLGEGLVDPEIGPMVRALPDSIPVSVHVEYLGRDDSAGQHLKALNRDRVTAASWISDQR